MAQIVAHVTAYDIPSLWLAFGGGLVVGVVSTYTLLLRRSR